MVLKQIIHGVYYGLLRIVKWTLSVYVVVFTSSKWEVLYIHQDRMNAAYSPNAANPYVIGGRVLRIESVLGPVSVVTVSQRANHTTPPH